MNRMFALVMFLQVFGISNLDAQQDSSKPWIWPSDPPPDCPFPKSKELVGIAFTGKHSNYRGYQDCDGCFADTWHPSWASDDKMYSPYADGTCPRLDGTWDQALCAFGKGSTTGQAVMEGDDPANLKIYSLAPSIGNPEPYNGRYPCGSLVYNGIWYYGTFCEGPKGDIKYGDKWYASPFLGPFIGFRISKDFGRSWTECPHSPEKPLFGENGLLGYPIKIGAPFFVDFGKNMEHSPDGKAYLVAHGSSPDDPKPRFGNTSWITGDQIYLLRVSPTPEAINDSSQYEFFAGYKKDGTALWANSLSKAKPLLEWNNNMGCVTVTYNAPLKKYLMCVTDGETTAGYMNTYILESENLTGPWKFVTYMKHFGEQAYDVNIPSKFVSGDGKTLWLCYSANYSPKEWNNFKIKSNPPGSHYGLILQEVKLLDKKTYRQYKNNPRPEIK